MRDTSFLELLILLHRLVVQVFAVHHEQHFVHVIELSAELCGLEGREGLS